MAQLLYRNVRARDHLEIFLVSAVSSLLALRFYLHLMHYPQVGNGTLHIAHMLWGGLLMLTSIVLMLAFLGARAQRTAALLGGIGFGIFIDELGKFITRDNNYFFRPAIGIIYAIFIVLYLVFNFISRHSRLTSREYQLNALNQFEEAVEHDMDILEKRRLQALLRAADQSSPVTQELKELLGRVEAVHSSEPSQFSKFLKRLDRLYEKFCRQRHSNQVVGVIFIIEAVLFLAAVFATFFNNVDELKTLLEGRNSYGTNLIVGQLAASLVAGSFAIIGALRLPESRLEAFEQFRRATLVNLLLTEFFIFSRIQFGALPGFAANLVLLAALRYAIEHEERIRIKASA